MHNKRFVHARRKIQMQIFMSILHSNNYLYELTTNDSNELENLFFVYPMSWTFVVHFTFVMHFTFVDNKCHVQIKQICCKRLRLHQLFVNVF